MPYMPRILVVHLLFLFWKISVQHLLEEAVAVILVID
jgi:hypothetical protein